MRVLKNFTPPLLACVILILLALFIYWPVRGYDLIQYDDSAYVTENEYVQRGLSREGFTWALTATHAYNWHPLTWLSLMADVEIYGMNAGGYHWTNVVLHLSNAVLLFFILAAMTGGAGRSFFVAALFAVHPLHVESVAWVAERKDVLSTFFLFWALAFYGAYAHRGGVGYYGAMLVSFVLGLMAKPMIVTLPFVLLLLDWWPLGRFSEGVSPYRLVGEKIPLFLFSAASSIVTYAVQKGALTSMNYLSFGDRLANALVAYVSYLGKMIYPVDLAVFYPHPGVWPFWYVMGAASVLVAVTLVCVFLIRRYPYLAVGWFWYAGMLIPVSGLIQVGGQSMADRYTYVPLVGAVIMVAWGATDFFKKWRYGMIALPSLAVICISGLLAVSMKQVRYWESANSLFQHAVEVTENNYLAENNLGAALQRQGNIDSAMRHYEEALRIRSQYADARFNMASALAEKGKWNEAIRYYSSALQIRPEFAEAWNNMGIALARTGRIDEAISHFEKALRVRPEYREAESNLRVAMREKESRKID